MLVQKKEKILEIVQGKHYAVLSSDGMNYYDVTIHLKQFCQCYDFTQGYSKDSCYLCKHIKMAQDYVIKSILENKERSNF